MKLLLWIGLLVYTVAAKPASNSSGRLIQNNWEDLRLGTTIRYFNPANFYAGGSYEDIWDDMGEDIYCNVNNDLTVNLVLPAGFDTTKPIKMVTHGFSSSATGGKTQFVNAWMERFNKEVNVILLNWPDLAFFGQAADWDSVFYDSAARNSIDVGEYMGHCLAAISAEGGLTGADMHLAGHSLGAHLMGKAGRVYTELTGSKIDRVTGLDPAGPRFVDGPISSAIPELHDNRLNTESASFVDVIHTDGSLTPAVVWFVPRAGDLHQMGHADYYPQGGSEQPGCGFGGPDALPGGICSHRRSTYYFLHSIWDPELFPSKACSDVDTCHDEIPSSDDIVAYMGHRAQEFNGGERKLYYLHIQDEHWDYEIHN